jgi:4'-phosphopantetheinyl transferase EntD
MGRAGAALAMESLGLDPAPVPVGRDRAPVWPAGVVGSISHTDTVSVAVAACSTDLLAVGIDIEMATIISQSQADMIATPGELSAAKVTGIDPGLLLFSAKEATYKCIYPDIGRFVDFRDLVLQIDEKKMSFRIGWSALPAVYPIRDDIFGHYFIDSGNVITLAYKVRRP